MKHHNTPALAGLLICMSIAASPHAHADEAGASNEIKTIDEILVDPSSGKVSAASLLGIPGDAIMAVENPKSFTMALKGLGSSGNAVGFSITPARTSFTPMSLARYDQNLMFRLIGSLSFSYAQGSAKIAEGDYESQAVSLETSATIHEKDDPVLVVKAGCRWSMGDVAPDKEPDFAKANKPYFDCLKDRTTAIEQHWNASRFSMSYGKGRIKRIGGPSASLGNTVALSMVYGFEDVPVDFLRKGAALSATVRHTSNAVVLASLATLQPVRRDSTIAALRLSGGSHIFRGLAEVSNVSAREAATANRVFRYAVGADYRIAEGTWVGLRAGKRYNISGPGQEMAGLFEFSFSPQKLP